MDELRIRRAREEEIPQIVALQKEVFCKEQDIPEELIGSFLSNHPICWVAEQNGRIVGSISSWEEEDAIHLGRFVVLPHLRGQGIGTKMIAHAVDELFRSGAESIYALARDSAARMLRAMGGRYVGEAVPFYRGNVTPVVLEKEAYRRLPTESKAAMTTERLLLRRMEEGDCELVYRLYSDEEIMRYSPFDLMDREAARRHLDKVLREWEEPSPSNREYVVIRREDGAALGRCHIELDAETDTAMIGSHLLKEAWGKGYATELARKLMAYSFEVLRVHRVNARCNPGNMGSRTVLERCGMRLEAHFLKKCRYVKRGEITWHDELEYALLREEWQQRQH